MKNLSFLLLFICSVSSAQYLVPKDYNLELDNYQSFISVGGVDYSMEFITSDNGLVSFWFHIENAGDNQVVLAKPVAKRLASDQFADVTADNETADALNSRDVKKYYEKKIRDAKTAKVISTIFSVALIVADVAADADDSQKFEWTKSDERNYVTRKAFTGLGLGVSDVVNHASHERMWNAKNELQYLPLELFDQTNIKPGESYGGKIVFREPFLKDYYRVKVVANGATLNFDFRKANRKERKFLRKLK